MAHRRKVLAVQRRTPTQARARATVEAIFEATARILERKGPHALNTNRIAEVAGISVGTLYGYFPDKRALLVAMARRILEEDREAITAAVSAALADPDAPPARVAIRKLIELHERRPEVRRAVMAVHLAEGLGKEHERSVLEVAELLASHADRLGRPAPRSFPPAALFVATRAVLGVVRAAFEERSRLLERRELEDELVRMVEGYVAVLRSDS